MWTHLTHLVVLLACCGSVLAQPPRPDTGDDALSLYLRYDAGGIQNVIRALEFSPDGNTLYVAGWSKMVQVYERDGATEQFEYKPRENFRVPIGLGRQGMLEAMALSEDGRWLAVAGWTADPRRADETAWVWPRGQADDQDWEESGAISIFDTARRECRVLRGHRGGVRALRFAEGDSDILISAGFEYTGQQVSQSIRAWSLSTENMIGQPLDIPRVVIPPSTDMSPRFRGWKSPDGQLHVAVCSWHLDRNLPVADTVVWRPGSAAAPQRLANAPVGFATELFRDQQQLRLFCGGFGDPCSFSLTGRAAFGRRPVAGGASTAVPMASVHIGPASPGRSDRVLVAAIERLPSGDRDYSLQVLEQDRLRRLGQLWVNRESAVLGPAPIIEPSLAASRDGRLLAVAGNRQNEVRLFLLRDLLNAGAGNRVLEPLQTLQSELLAPVAAALVKHDDDSGIALIPARPDTLPATLRAGEPLPPDVLIISSGERRVLDNPDGWVVDAAITDEWTVSISADRTQVAVRGAGQDAERPLRIPADFRVEDSVEVVTAAIVCDASGGNPPLAVVAWHLQGEPLLAVFDADTGQFLRLLQGHDHRITNLSISSDGDLLLSASLDGTVRGWLLKDIAEKCLGKIGRVPGLFLTDRGGEVVVDRVSPDSDAARLGIAAGDRIPGQVVDAELLPFASAADFYRLVSQTPPTEIPRIDLRVRRATSERDVELPLAQGADLAGPLFSLLVAEPPPGPGDRGWLVWSPAGQFDLGGTAMDSRLGWHINTQVDAEPVSYASIDQYRERFAVDGLLQQLLTDGTPVVQRPAGPPVMRVAVVTDDGQVLLPNYDDEVVLRKSAAWLILEFEDRTGELVQSATWSLPGEPARSFLPVDSGLWKSGSPVTEAGRGAHLIQIELTTTDLEPVEYRRNVFLRYQPEAPQIRLLSPEQQAGTSDTALVTLEAEIDVTVPASVTVIHEFGDRQLEESTIAFDESGRLNRELTLRPGPNTIRIVAVNDEIPANLSEYAAEETATVETRLDYSPPGPPVIAVRDCRQGGDGPSLAIVDGQFVSQSDIVRIAGTITGMRPLTSAGLNVGGQSTELAGFSAGAAAEFTFTQEVRLQPGEQTLVLRAAVENQETEVALTAVYRPRLPDVSLRFPADRLTVIAASGSEYSLPVVADVAQVNELAWESQVLVDGIPRDDVRLTFDSDAGTLSGSVPMMADPRNPRDIRTIRLALFNEWGSRHEELLQVEFRHPPLLKSAELMRGDRSATAEIHAQVSDDPLRPLTNLLVTVAGEPVSGLDFQVEPLAPGTAAVTVADVPLRPGANEIHVVAENRDGGSAALVLNELVEAGPPPAIIRLLDPVTNITSAESAHMIAFAVESRAGLSRVDVILSRDHRQPQRISLLRSPIPQEQPVRREFTQQVELTEGVNRVRIVVQNPGGVSRREFSITCLPPPIAIHLTRLSALDGTWELPAIDRGAGLAVFDRPAPGGQAVLHGQLSWLPGHRPPGDDWTLRVWVNGFLRAARIRAPDETQRSVDFEVPLVFNQTVNRLRLEAPEVSWSNQRLALSDHRFPALQNIAVRCSSPEQRQRLHLVIMGVEMEAGRNVARADELKQFATEALRVESPESAFAEIRNYAPLVGEQAVGRNLRTLMVLVETDIAQRRAMGRLNDVVMFYYHGREYRDAKGEFVLEDFQNYQDPLQHPLSIRESYLAGLFEHLPGAHVVFLDVENSQSEDTLASHWPRFPNLGLFRVAWSGQPPVPEPPGPLLSLVREAGTQAEGDGSVRLETLEQAFHAQAAADAAGRRFHVATFVPEDLLNLMIAKLTQR